MEHKPNGKVAIVDFDDLSNIWDCYDYIQKLKENNPKFKCTLFAIPKLCSPMLIKKYKELDFVELAMHGWHHTFCETWTWSVDAAKDKMQQAENMGIDAKGFKAPKWVMHDSAYQACEELGWWVSDHRRNKALWSKHNANVYCYNLKTRGKDSIIKLHGHTHNVMGNGIEEAFESFDLPRGTEYRFISEMFRNGEI